MATRNARELRIAGATVTDNGNFCFQADSSGTYNFVAVASNACGVDSCQIVVQVMVGAKPVITCPTEPFKFALCKTRQICIPIPINGADSVEVSGGATWADGNVCFNPVDVGSFPLHIVASNKCGKTACDITVEVTQVPLPQIACPTEPAKFTLCGPGEQVCAPLTVLDADSVQVSEGAVWKDGSVCFTPDTAGTYTFHVRASNSCSTDNCDVRFEIAFVPAPNIGCTEEINIASACSGKEICVPFPIENATSVETSIGRWSEGQLCFTPDTSGSYVVHVKASNTCHTSECNQSIRVTVLPLPTIACRDGNVKLDVCGARQIGISLTIRNATVVTSPNGTWKNDTLYFQSDTSGTYNLSVRAENECGTSECAFAVVVTRHNIPVIHCPAEPLVVKSCSEQVCVPFIASAEFADSIIAVGAHLTDDNLCFTATQSGLYSIPLRAISLCGSDTCTVQVSVELVQPPVIACPDSTQHFTLCQPGPVCIPLAIRNSDSVTIAGGVWNPENQTVCIEADKTGEYFAEVVARGQCKSDTCRIHAIVTITPAPVIACPEQPLSGSICRPGQVCVDLAIANATRVEVPGATWSNDRLCFNADTAGIYTFAVAASNQCHTTTCSLTVHVEIAGAINACFKPEYGGRALTLAFTNCTTPVGSFQYRWNFGDGSTSEEFAPNHTYTSAGCYAVALEAFGLCGEDTIRNSVVDTVCVQDTNLVVPTDQWINAYCEAPTLDGIALHAGDVIAAYAPGNILCGLDVVRANGAFGFMPIYRDDQYTPEIEGAKPGDTIAFKINGHAVFTDPVVVWTENGARIPVCNFLAELCRNLVLGEGWHLVSWNVPLMGDINTIFGDQLQCIDVILSYDRGAVTFDPDMTKFSTLHSVDYSHGYWIKVKPACTVTLKLCGNPITSGGIPIYRGWNLVSYWPTGSMTPPNALTSLGSLVTGVWGFDNGAFVYKPDLPEFSTLDSLRPNFGYWVKSTDAGSLVYPGFGSTPVVASGQGDKTNETVTPSRDWMSIYGDGITVDGKSLSSGSRIAAVTADGTICGEGVYADGILKFTPIYGRDDADVATKVYAESGDQVYLEVNGRPVFPAIKWQGEGTRIRLAALYTNSEVNGAVPKQFALSQNYPNPFNPTTTIEYGLPTSSRVMLEVFNVAGQRVAILVNGTSMEAGYHTTYWDGTDENGSQVASGIYFYRLKAGSYSETRKMMLLK